jgi:AcrR family transcriptional regulator
VNRTNAHADQRRRILRATGGLVAERGYADITVELIVKRAKVSFKTLYKHFPGGREECFIALFEDAFEVTERKIRERLAAEPMPWAQQVVVAIRTLFETIIAEPAIARAVIVESLTLGLPVTERYEQGTKALAPLFRAGRKHNRRGSELPTTVEDTLAGTVFWSAYQRLVVGEADRLLDDLPVLLELILRTYVGPAKASCLARAETPARQPALA